MHIIINRPHCLTVDTHCFGLNIKVSLSVEGSARYYSYISPCTPGDMQRACMLVRASCDLHEWPSHVPSASKMWISGCREEFLKYDNFCQ